jgi:hypothetical protein
MVVCAIAILLLIRPLDCLAFGTSPGETSQCCLKGKCAPTAKADDCCRASVPDSSQSVAAAATRYSSPSGVLTTVRLPATVPAPGAELGSDRVGRLPPLNRAPYTRPLLI